MRADAIDIEIFGHRLRITVADDDSREDLRSRLAEFLIDEPAPTGFIVKAPEGSNNLHVVLDRSGLVLGRARTAAECVGIVGRHLGALIPPPPHSVRLRMRALVDLDGRAVLAGFPLFSHPAPVERRLQRLGFRLLDRLNVDVAIDTPSAPTVVVAQWGRFGDVPDCIGHVPDVDGQYVIESILLAGDHPRSKALTVAEIASNLQGSSVEILMDCAELLSALPIQPVMFDDLSAPYEALDVRRG